MNLGYGLKLLSKDYKERGNTKSLDAQVHFYPGKWTIDALAIRHKGAYLDKEDYTAVTANTYYSRHDVQQNYFGLSAYYILNGDRFSYRAAMLQNEWQTKSAGSLLVGAAVNVRRLKGDSALVPDKAKTAHPEPGITKINFITAGPGIGYAYTLVMAKHFFVMGSLVANLALNYSAEKSKDETNRTLGLEPGAVYKAALGYNSDTWNISGNWAGNTMFTDNLSSLDAYRASTGTFRVVLAKRLAL